MRQRFNLILIAKKIRYNFSFSFTHYKLWKGPIQPEGRQFPMKSSPSMFVVLGNLTVELFWLLPAIETHLNFVPRWGGIGSKNGITQWEELKKIIKMPFSLFKNFPHMAFSSSDIKSIVAKFRLAVREKSLRNSCLKSIFFSYFLMTNLNIFD